MLCVDHIRGSRIIAVATTTTTNAAATASSRNVVQARAESCVHGGDGGRLEGETDDTVCLSVAAVNTTARGNYPHIRPRTAPLVFFFPSALFLLDLAFAGAAEAATPRAVLERRPFFGSFFASSAPPCGRLLPLLRRLVFLALHVPWGALE